MSKTFEQVREEEYDAIKTRIYAILSNEIVQSQTQHHFHNVDKREWFKTQLVVVLKKIDTVPELFYKTIALLNRNSRSGVMAITFNDEVNANVRAHDEEAFERTLRKPVGDFEKVGISTMTKEKYTALLKSDMLTVNSAMDTAFSSALSTGEIPETFLLSEVQSVCLTDPLESAGSVRPVWISSRDDKTGVVNAMCFQLPKLLELIVKGLPNPYDGKPFAKHIVMNILRTYMCEVEIMYHSVA